VIKLRLAGWAVKNFLLVTTILVMVIITVIDYDIPFQCAEDLPCSRFLTVGNSKLAQFSNESLGWALDSLFLMVALSRVETPL
jgi:hypothetical protein